jgi:NADH:ubiquinone oxidoreductase subunit
MGMFKNIFTWWEGASFGTALNTMMNGRQMGEDGLGNLYYEGKAADNGRHRRWVIYKGSNDPSRVPPEWHGWLHNMIDDLPADGLPAPRAWEQPATANLTGSEQAYRPQGAPEPGKHRAAATGDYVAWSPEQS